MRRFGSIDFLILVATVAPAVAADAKAGDLVFEQPWSRATPGGGDLPSANHGTTPDR